MRSFAKIKPSQNGEITLRFTNVRKSCSSRESLTLQIFILALVAKIKFSRKFLNFQYHLPSCSSLTMCQRVGQSKFKCLVICWFFLKDCFHHKTGTIQTGTSLKKADTCKRVSDHQSHPYQLQIKIINWIPGTSAVKYIRRMGLSVVEIGSTYITL